MESMEGFFLPSFHFSFENYVLCKSLNILGNLFLSSIFFSVSLVSSFQRFNGEMRNFVWQNFCNETFVNKL